MRAAVKELTSTRPVSRNPRKPLSKRIAAKLVSVVALALAAAFAVATAASPLLFSGVTTTASISHAKSSTIDDQHLSAAPGKETPITRGSFAALSANELYALNVGGLNYTVNNSGPIRWPFDYPVPIGSHFGPRAAPCLGCSTFHRGTDFETGDGAPVYAVADGVVTADEFTGSYGQYIEISHNVNGLVFSSIYAHLQKASATLQPGAVVTEGEIVGLTGSTGQSTGPHLDFEIDIGDGDAIDSLVWLKANTAH